MFKSSLSLILLLSFIITSLAFAVDVPSIQAELKKANATWIAKPNAITHLSKAEIKNLLGSLEEPNGNALFFDRRKSVASLDWRNKDGVSWLGPVLNQGNCGSCVAFASVATLEARFRIAQGVLWANPTFSPQQLFNCGGGACSRGWFPGSAASFLKKNGVVDLACSPYLSGSTGLDVSCREIKCDDQAKRIYKIANYSSPSAGGGSAEKVKEALKTGPLVTSMTVYTDFLTYAGGIYKHTTGNREGGHAISIVGYNDQERYWIIRNSWGPDWGEGGFVRISYDDDSGIGNSTYAFDINDESSYFAVLTPSNHQYFSGTQELKVSMKSREAVTLQIKGESENYTVECEAKDENICTQKLDTTTLRDGRYEIFAQTETLRSQVKEFFVVNHAPETQVSFVRADGKPFSTPFTGRIEFNIDIKASPVIPQMLTFYVEDMNGKIVAKRTTDLVTEQMKLGFRFNTIPNAQYKIYYVAETPYGTTQAQNKSNIETITSKN